MNRLTKNVYKLAEKFVRNFVPELNKSDRSSLFYLLEKKSVEEAANYIYNNMGSALRFQNRYEYIEFVISKLVLDGELLEFGVGGGTSINQIAGIVDREVHGFDSFEGLPDDGILGSATLNKNSGMKWFAGKVKHSAPQVKTNVILHKGWFEDTIPDFLQSFSKRIALLHIDCDIYSSTKTVFHYFGKYITPGTIIMFDEYFGYYGWPYNEFKAFREFVAEYSVTYEYIAYSGSGEAAVRIKSLSGKP